jgi:hypothetical protein
MFTEADKSAALKGSFELFCLLQAAKKSTAAKKEKMIFIILISTDYFFELQYIEFI